MDNEQTLKDLFDKSQENNDKMQFSSEEASRFKKAFDDPEFRKLFSEYVDELSDPKNRQETEAYISQLEGEQKVPEGKELIRPEPAFVVKSYKTVKSSGSDKGKEKEKLFLNIVQSLKIDEPSKSNTPKGTCWSVPYSVGPPHMEKDKSGSNSPCFDCCFHPEALRLCSKIKEFKELVIHTAMEGVEQSYKRQGQDITLDRDFHVVKGVAYKDGQVPTMMIAMSSKSNWKPDSESPAGSCPDNAIATSSASLLKSVGSTTHAQDCLVPMGGAKTTAPAIKKGFLSSAKTALYGDKLTTIRPKTTGTAFTADPPKSTIKLTRDAPEQSTLAVDGDLSLTRASRASTAGELIQEVVQPGMTNGTRTSASSRPRSPKMKVDADTGLKELSSSRKTPPSTSQSAAVSINSNTSVPPSGSVPEEGDKSSSPIVTEGTSVSANGLREPKYTFKERGSMSMGDFELSNNNNNNNSSNVRSNRPSELVYRIELPGIKNASQIVLDVAERQLNLSYPGMYALSLKLPYPVFDRKGTAKFDKGGSALNVTLPVQPRKLHCDPPSSPGNSDSSVVDAVILSDVNEAHRPVQAADEATSPNCDRSSSTQSKHGRWISSEAGSATPPINAVIDGGVSPGDGVERVLSLRDEIKLKAELALKEASEMSRNEATHRPIRAAEETTIAQDLTEDASTSRERFIPSSTFTGSRKGYVFKRDGEGMGYYLDDVQQLTRGSGGVADSKGCLSVVSGADSAASIDFPSRLDTASTISSDDSLLLLPFDFDCRQTKQTIAVLVQVPSIDAASVQIEFAPHQLWVSFRAVGPDGLLPGSLYGMTFDVSPQSTCLIGFNPEQCKYDVACQNMAIILVKSIPAYWSVKTSGDDNKEASDDAETINSVTGESKSSADYELQATKELLRARPYEAKKDNASTGNSGMSKLADSSSAETAPEWNKALPKSLENMIANMQFSSSAVLFDLD